jgi:hypothetical protein
MGTRSLIQLAVRDETGKLTVYAVLYNQYDGYYHGIGAILARFLSDAVIVNGCDPMSKENQFNGPGDLFVRIIALFKTSPHQIGGCYLSDPTLDCVVGEDWIEYVYRVIVDAENKIIFSAESDNDELPSFTGSADDFITQILNTN